MFKKISGSPSPSVQAPRTSAPSNPAPTAAPRAAPAPSAPPQGGDGFAARARPSAGSHVPTASSARGLALPPGKDVSKDFANNPSQFMSNNTLNAYNSTNNFKGTKQEGPEGIPTPPPGNTSNPQELRLTNAFVPARDSRVTMHVNQQPGGNANMSFSPVGGTTGVQAHYMPYVSQGAGTFGGVNRIPMHPQEGDPKMVVTGPLNGCAVHAFHDNSNNTMAFVHQANFSKTGDADFNKFKAANPNLQHLESIKPQDYAQPIKNGRPGDEPGATAFAHYEPRPGQPSGQWKLSGQINELNGQFQHMNDPKIARQELKRPDLEPIMVPDGVGGQKPTPRPLHIQKPLDPQNPLSST